MRIYYIGAETGMALRVNAKRAFQVIPWLLLGFVSLPASAVEIGDKLELSGLAEVIGSFTSDDISGEDSSNIDLSKVELYLDAAIADRITSNMTIKWEEDDLFMDTATITMAINDMLSVTGGRVGLPFGNYSTNLVSDPITKDLADITEGALQLGFENGDVSGSVYVYNSAVEIAGDDPNKVSGVGANIGFKSEMDGNSLELGAGYISNIADGNISAALTAPIDSEVAGLSLFGSWTRGPVNVIGEYIMSMDDFLAGELGSVSGQDVAPTAANLEVAYDLGNGMTFAAAYQVTDEAVDLGLPETRLLLGLSKKIAEGATIAAEYQANDDYDTSDGGTGESSSTLSFQMLVEF